MIVLYFSTTSCDPLACNVIRASTSSFTWVKPAHMLHMSMLVLMSSLHS